MSPVSSWNLNLVAALRQMPQGRWRCLNFPGTRYARYIRLVRFSFLIMIGCFVTLNA